jgi:hypothetical protein
MRFVKYSEEALRNPLQKQREKQQLADQLRVRGTSQIPNPQGTCSIRLDRAEP